MRGDRHQQQCRNREIAVGSGRADSTTGRYAIAWSIVKDRCAVVIVAALIALTGEGHLAASVGLASLKALLFVVAALAFGLRLVPWLLERASTMASPELFVLAITALALGMALGSERVGLSIAFGAFLAGMMVSESDVSQGILEKLLPARDVFAALFFVSVGMLIDPDVLADLWLLASLLAVIVGGKAVLTYALARVAGLGARRGVDPQP